MKLCYIKSVLKQIMDTFKVIMSNETLTFKNSVIEWNIDIRYQENILEILESIELCVDCKSDYIDVKDGNVILYIDGYDGEYVNRAVLTIDATLIKQAFYDALELINYAI